MKMITILSLGIWPFLPSHAQFEFSFLNLRSTDSAVVYRGIENPIEIKNVGDYVYPYQVKAIFGRVERRGERPVYFYKCNDINTNTDTLVIYKEGKEMCRKPIEVRRISHAVVYLAGHKSGSRISRQLVLAVPYFVVISPGSLYRKYDVIHRTTVHASYGGQKVEFKMNGNRLAPELLDEIKTGKSPITMDCSLTYHGMSCGITQSFHCEIF